MNTYSQPLFRFLALGFFLAVPACSGGGLGIPGSECTSIKDRSSCLAEAACIPVGCPDCDGEPGFSGCYDKNNAPQLKCATLPCPPPQLKCSDHTDAASCKASGCELALPCPECDGGGPGAGFLGCYDPGQAPSPVCPLYCPWPDCTSITTEGDCESNSACHAVYIEKLACACAGLGCCTSFDHCAPGPAQCAPTPDAPPCKSPTPLCEGDFVVDYAGGCPIGCVRGTACNDCRKNGCTPGTTCQPCWTTWECMDPWIAC